MEQYELTEAGYSSAEKTADQLYESLQGPIRALYERGKVRIRVTMRITFLEDGFAWRSSPMGPVPDVGFWAGVDYSYAGAPEASESREARDAYAEAVTGSLQQRIHDMNSAVGIQARTEFRIMANTKNRIEYRMTYVQEPQQLTMNC